MFFIFAKRRMEPTHNVPHWNSINGGAKILRNLKNTNDDYYLTCKCSPIGISGESNDSWAHHFYYFDLHFNIILLRCGTILQLGNIKTSRYLYKNFFNPWPLVFWFHGWTAPSIDWLTVINNSLKTFFPIIVKVLWSINAMITTLEAREFDLNQKLHRFCFDNRKIFLFPWLLIQIWIFSATENKSFATFFLSTAPIFVEWTFLGVLFSLWSALKPFESSDFVFSQRRRNS